MPVITASTKAIAIQTVIQAGLVMKKYGAIESPPADREGKSKTGALNHSATLPYFDPSKVSPVNDSSRGGRFYPIATIFDS
jgi:hypothetical protein